MSHSNTLFGTGLTGVALLCAPPAIAAQYLTAEAAQHAIFPEADAFVPVVVPLDTAQRQRLAERAGAQPRHGRLQVLVARRGGQVLGHLFIDEVIGREDLITYALGIDAGGTLRTPEILDYRESHGNEVRGRAWREQFNHRQGLQALSFGTQIQNLAGATLSSEHLTQGIRWLTALWELALAPRATPAAAP